VKLTSPPKPLILVTLILTSPREPSIILILVAFGTRVKLGDVLESVTWVLELFPDESPSIEGVSPESARVPSNSKTEETSNVLAFMSHLSGARTLQRLT
jgi:hypothetical protein